MKIVALLLVAVAGCYGATTVELLASNPNESELVRLVQRAGLVDALNRGTYTIFAPTNAAFNKIPSSTLAALENDTQALSNILLYHVVQGRVLFAPTNAAFAKLSSRAVSRITGNTKLLADILAYHVVPKTEYSVGLYNRERLTTLDYNNDTIAISANSITGVRVNTGRVTKADISATNGVIHEIDNVLVPLRYLGIVILGWMRPLFPRANLLED